VSDFFTRPRFRPSILTAFSCLFDGVQRRAHLESGEAFVVVGGGDWKRGFGQVSSWPEHPKSSASGSSF
jgi:hypothetical protein